jgi:hypothetical protein
MRPGYRFVAVAVVCLAGAVTLLPRGQVASADVRPAPEAPAGR